MPFASAELLQFDELKELVSGYAGSAAGSRLVMALDPHTDRAVLGAELAETGEAIEYAREASGAQTAGSGTAMRLHFDQMPDVEEPLRILHVEGASLEGRDILDLFHLIDLAGEYRGILNSAAGRYPSLAQRARTMADLRPVVRRYQTAFLPDGSLTDDASVALRRIRRDMERQQRSIQESLERFLRAHRSDGTLQEDFVTIREDRYVVPIVAGQKGRVNGVIHGSSGSGRTLFVEPLDTIDLNNQLVRLREDERREIERILAEITNVLRAHADEIAASAGALACFDLLFAKAAFARDFDAVIPLFSTEPRRLVLREARHPLLQAVLRTQRKRVVPVSFALDQQTRCLLISGPNTGGKTVTLKTAGLLAIMAHAAIPVPCVEAEFPLFDDVLADIGDQQSIAESLSSFSGHLIHVKQMLERVSPSSLVLLDELGRATDPEEGGALGVAILDQFRKSGAFCLASTHLLPMKLYGAQTPGVLNGSMGFDEASLQPTYTLQLGMPGQSAGLDIATRLELPHEILSHARSVLPRIHADFQDLLAELHRQREQNAQAGREMEAAKRQLAERQAQIEAEAARAEERRRREWAKKSEGIVADFEARAQMLMAQLPETLAQRKSAEQAQRLISKAKREFREEAAQALPSVQLSKAPGETLPIEEGARVRLKDVREPATVRRVLKNGMLEVEAGFLRMQIPREDVAEVISAKIEPSRLPGSIRVETDPRGDESYRELNIIGQHVDEAVEQVDKFLDSAALASVDRVRIVHGHGMGILKRAVSEHLGSNPHVSRFYPAAQAEGGSGATIVELRQ